MANLVKLPPPQLPQHLLRTYLYSFKYTRGKSKNEMWQLEVKLDSSFDKMCLYWLLPVLLKKILTWHQHILCTSNYILLTSSSEERIFVVKIAPLQIKILQNIVGNFSNSPSPTLFFPLIPF